MHGETIKVKKIMDMIWWFSAQLSHHMTTDRPNVRVIVTFGFAYTDGRARKIFC